MMLLCWLIPNPAANSHDILKQKPSTFVLIISKCVIGHYFKEKGGKSGYQVLKCFVCFVDFRENLLCKAQEFHFTVERVVWGSVTLAGKLCLSVCWKHHHPICASAMPKVSYAIIIYGLEHG